MYFYDRKRDVHHHRINSVSLFIKRIRQLKLTKKLKNQNQMSLYLVILFVALTFL